ncbi:MAG TPA: DUF1097 domain-containing protein [Methyloceanibacter sp.]
MSRWTAGTDGASARSFTKGGLDVRKHCTCYQRWCAWRRRDLALPRAARRPLAIWAAFIAWGCFFHCGGKEHGLQSAILCNAAGAIIAGITLIVATKTGLADRLGLPVWAAICVGIGVAAMVLLANIPLFAAIPAQVYGFASVVAYTLMKDAAGSLTAAALENPVVIVILSMIVGAVFGYVSEKVAGMLAGMGSHPRHAKA